MRKTSLYIFLSIILFFFMTLFTIEKYLIEPPQPVYGYGSQPTSKFTAIKVKNETDTTMKLSNKKFIPSDILQVWTQENIFLDSSLYFIQGYGPDLKSQVPLKRNKNMINLVVIGDSFVYGEAIENTEIRWERMLQYYLDKETETKHGKKIFNVIPIGRGASSFNNYIEWLTDDRINRLDPDAIIFSYVGNDNYPSFTEKSFCRELNTCTKDNEPLLYSDCGPRCDLASCLLGESSLFGKIARKFLNPYFPNTTKFILERYCDPDKLNQRYGLYSESGFKYDKNITKHPYYKIFKDSIIKGSKIRKEIPKFIYFAKDEYYENSKWPEFIDFSNYNYKIIPGIEFNKLAKEYNFKNNPKYRLNIDDKHPNGVVTSKYGKDVANYIYSYFSDNGSIKKYLSITQNEIDNNYFTVSNYLPNTLVTSTNLDTIIFSHDNNFINNFSGNEYPYEPNNQYFPCARVNYPHSRMVFSRDIEKLRGRTINIEAFIESTQNGDKFFLQPFGIDNDGNEIYYDNYIINQNKKSKLDFIIPDNFSGFMLIDTSNDCKYYFIKNGLNNNERMNLPSFTIKYKLI